MGADGGARVFQLQLQGAQLARRLQRDNSEVKDERRRHPDVDKDSHVASARQNNALLLIADCLQFAV